jgi:hypothetical protein
VEHHAVPPDEGYEEGKMDDNRKFSTAVTHLNFINFANARKRKQGKKVGYRVMFYLLHCSPLCYYFPLQKLNFSCTGNCYC